MVSQRGLLNKQREFSAEAAAKNKKLDNNFIFIFSFSSFQLGNFFILDFEVKMLLFKRVLSVVLIDLSMTKCYLFNSSQE